MRRTLHIPAVSLLLPLCLAACEAERTVEETAPAVDPRLGGAVSVPEGAQAMSFLGDTLLSPDQPEEARELSLARYREAEDVLAATPEDVDALIWMGRRTAYLGQYREAIDIYTYALTLHPDDARLYRHRGHRYLTVRELDHAIADFERAAQLTTGQADEVEPDGLPNERNIPTSTLQFNIWYHLALAHYVRGDLQSALEAYRSCLAVSVHPDSVVATSYWLYMTLRRLGNDDAAQAVLSSIHVDMEIIESTSYLDLLLLFKGERTWEDFVGPAGEAATLQSTTTAYGLGVWHLLNDRLAEAQIIWETILTARNQWNAFGYLAAEGELARMPQ